MSTATAANIEEAEEIVTRLLTDPPQDPYPLYARLRAIDPIHRAAIGDFWTLTRYGDIHTALKDRRFVRDYDDFRRRNSRGRVDYNRPFIRSQRLWFVFYNPPEYIGKRALYGKAFTPTYVDELRPAIERFASQILDAAEARGRLDVVHELGYQLTLTGHLPHPRSGVGQGRGALRRVGARHRAHLRSACHRGDAAQGRRRDPETRRLPP